MIRRAAIGCVCAGVLVLGGCNRNQADRREQVMFGADEGVWYNANGERVHHWQLTQMQGGEWYAAKAEREAEDRYASEDRGDDTWAEPSENARQDRTCPCPNTAAKQRMRDHERDRMERDSQAAPE